MNTCAHEVDPSLNADGSLMSFNATSREDSQGNRDVYLYDVARKSMLDFWFVNSKVLDTATSLSSDGNFIAFNSERNHSELASRGRDIFLLDLRSDEFIFLPGLNSDFEDSAPALSRDARNLLFHSKRPGSLGGYDLYLYRRD
jgi:Tol biopolymer transport system component